MTIQDHFHRVRTTSSDINEHIPTLKKYAEMSESIVEMGVRSIVSTWAFLAGKPKKLLSIDKVHPSEFRRHDPNGCDIELVLKLARNEGIDFEFKLADTLEIQIPECDLLFIDTIHEYQHLKKELERHADKAKKFIIFHDTESAPELNIAIEELEGWKVRERFTNNNGLTICEKC